MNQYTDDHWIAFTLGSAGLLGLLAALALTTWVGIVWGLVWLGIRMPMEYVRHR